MPSKIKLPSEAFLPPVMRYNDNVGPLFSVLRERFPLDEHHESGLARSLGVFLGYCYRKAVSDLQAIKPAPVLSRDEWSVAPEDVKRIHLHWQTNLKYLKQRNRHYVELVGYRGLSNDNTELEA